jgi:D-alanyl-D-alanine carboxypeptidase/D-alanyl-D-alanine-endopeptidase (penicillin-binding protein 4)
MGRLRVLALLLVAAVCALAVAAGSQARTTGTSSAGAPHGGSFSPGPLARRLAGALAVPHVKPSLSGAVAIDLATGQIVYALNPDRSLAPASNQKLALTYAALVELGPSYRFRTQVVGTGSRSGATWNGTLYLHGGGDPTLERRGLRRLAAQLYADGLRRISGDVLADESWFDAKRTAPGWLPGFYLNESPALSALAVARGWYHGRSTTDPAGAAAATFVRILNERGVHVGGESAWGTAPATAFPLAQVDSAPLQDVLRYMDRESDNYTAELVLKALGAEIAGKGTTAAGASVVIDALREAGVPLAGVRVADGSGLSRFDRLTPRALAAILLASWDDADLRPVVWDSLPVAGRNGTLEKRLESRPAYGAVRAKTGTTAVASALSGFVRHRYAFAVVQNGHPISTSWARMAQDRFATVLAAD